MLCLFGLFKPAVHFYLIYYLELKCCFMWWGIYALRYWLGETHRGILTICTQALENKPLWAVWRLQLLQDVVWAEGDGAAQGGRESVSYRKWTSHLAFLKDLNPCFHWGQKGGALFKLEMSAWLQLWLEIGKCQAKSNYFFRMRS